MLLESLHKISSLFERSAGRDAGFGVLNRATEDLGFPYVIYAPVRNHSMSSQNWAVTSYPAAWQELYAEKGYHGRNPVRNRTLISSRAFTWSALEADLSEDERVIFQDARACGMADAVVVPLHGPWGQTIAMGFATDRVSAITPKAIPMLQILAHHFHQTYNDESYVSDVRLTDREQDIMTRVAMGFSGYQIADVLCLSPNSVEWHMKNIFAKLGVRSRTAALVRSIQLGLIDI